MGEFEGKLVYWNSEKGFGFIKPKTKGKDIFLHIRNVRQNSSSPLVGDTVFYTTKEDGNGEIRAYDAHVHGAPVINTEIHFKLSIFKLIFVAIPFMLSLYIVRTTYYPLILYTLFSFVCFFTYAIDKRKAITNDDWRISESTLHFLELIGGWPGALIAQQQFRHKTKKISFQKTFWLIVLLHFALWFDYLFLGQSMLMRAIKLIEYIPVGHI